MGLVHELFRLISALVLLSPAIKCALQCQDMWELWGEDCYMFSDRYSIGFDQKQTHQQARVTCLAEQAWLLQLESPEEARFIADKIASSVILDYKCTLEIGGSHVMRFLIWLCVNPESNALPDFHVWQGDPAKAGLTEGCVGLNTTDSPTLFPTSCNTSLHFVCEKGAVDPEYTESTEASMTTIEAAVTATAGSTSPIEPMTPCEDQGNSQTDRPASKRRSALFASTFASHDPEGRPQAGLCPQGHVMAIRRARSPVACAVACSRDARCRSFNFNENEERCEMMIVVESGNVGVLASEECVHMMRVL